MNEEKYQEYLDYLEDQDMQEEAFYYSVVNDCVALIKSYGAKKVLTDVFSQFERQAISKGY